MKTFENIRRIERLHSFIKRRSTGTPAEAARRLGLSESHFYLLLKQLREECPAPIYYSKRDRSYCYEWDVEFIIGFVSA